MIETVDSRCVKRAKPTDCRREIVYEMDDDGNLQPITGSIDRPISSSRQMLAVHDYHQTCQARRIVPISLATNKKENRRFPIRSRVDADTVAEQTARKHLFVDAAPGVGVHVHVSLESGTTGERKSDPVPAGPTVSAVTSGGSALESLGCGPVSSGAHRDIPSSSTVHSAPHHVAPPALSQGQQQQQQQPTQSFLVRQRHHQNHHQQQQQAVPGPRNLDRTPKYLYLGPAKTAATTASLTKSPMLSSSSLSSVSLFHGNGRYKAATPQSSFHNGIPVSSTSLLPGCRSASLKLLTLDKSMRAPPPAGRTNRQNSDSAGHARLVSGTSNNLVGSSSNSHLVLPKGVVTSSSLPLKCGPRIIKVLKLPSSSTSRKLISTGERALCLAAEPPDAGRAAAPSVRAVSSLHISSVRGGGVASGSGARTPSVLRTVLTDAGHQQRQRREVPPHQRPVDAESPYVISSSGSLSAMQLPALLHQYDGVADEPAGTDYQHHQYQQQYQYQYQQQQSSVLRARTGGKDALSAVSAASKPGDGDGAEYGYCLRFSIQGFKASKSPKSTWTYLVRRVAQLRQSHGLTEYTLRTGDGWAKFGLEHRHVVYLIEQLVGAFHCYQYEFQFHKTRIQQLRKQHSPHVPSVRGCARFEPWTKTRPEHVVRDPLAFLQCKANGPPKNHAPDSADQFEEDPPPDSDYLQNLASQFRLLQSGAEARERNVRVCCSVIHGRGLFARRGFNAHDIVVEYVGEVIRSILSDVRETEYQRTGVDCYMFRLDQDHIVDATLKGNAARFINHSCHPNCYAKVVRFEGGKHIIIIAQRTIHKGEELTYDYRFPIEDDKLPCTCGSFGCRKYLN